MNIQLLKSKNLILFEVISGSKSFGLNTPTSDTDIKGVYYLPKEKFFGLDYIPQISNDTNDEVYYELGRFVELLLKNNPNILEILASPEDCILYQHPIMKRLKIEDFLSKLCKDSFAGYAVTQIKKSRGLNKKIVNPIPKEKKSLLDFCYVLKGYETVGVHSFLAENNFNQAQCGLVNLPNSKGMFALFYDSNKTLGYKGIIQKENSNEVSVSSVPKNEEPIGYLSCNQDGYSKYCKEYTEYWSWIEKRNEDRYNTNQQHGKNYDSKNMMHTIRLLQTAAQILATGTLNIRVANREELLDIKAGNKEYDDLLEMADNLIASIENHYETSTLPEKPDEAKAIQTLISIREELYQ
ncbi:nucleotidyltransferase domain-containing protein [Flavobacterium sp. Fl-77]|uniref:Nucleotidyltransferase domain-containing protein n=1 Tax=Flavobacterium flavipigmentatum TaxID=2893884 RepID=A0AAJ2SFK2_9FLAO|nr:MULTISPECIES: nucleotidyltransferase domain-containing protein [unclassified Flavobacterium]MDX6183988.1 nucleotidyltransferase domain-containing protein [Flavobacterium sp. Fl-33]MDX6187541.1 nucleotidyltransferase domain-containing protein [Flavobacterium sp. Fl-77]UFH38434.1 nucleotidyltransferase domain-containing protein [Flavobacterium sp. F-70]